MPIPILNACNIPVYRYALQNWPADEYVVLWYFQSQTPELSVCDSLLTSSSANCRVNKIDVNTPAGKIIAEENGVSVFPWMQVSSPQNPETLVLWSGPLTRDHLAHILHSPVRSRLARQLLQGQAAVWVLLKSGAKEADQKAVQTLHSALQKANAVQSNSFTDDLEKYSFAEMVVDRLSPEEKFFVDCLLHSEPDLCSWSSPMLFPVFGRGRVLYALVGEGIQEKNILDACQAVTGWCSCEVKALNPGCDLLLAMDWTHSALPMTMSETIYIPAEQAARKSREKPVSVYAKRPKMVPDSIQKRINASITRHNTLLTNAPVKEMQERRSLHHSLLFRNMALVSGIGVLVVVFGIFCLTKKKYFN